MQFDAIVIGSGFGGAVSACRLAQAGLSVCIIERGRRYPAGSFPRDMTRLDSGWSYRNGQGLFDIKPVAGKFMSVQSAGYGGGSLVYANVIMRPPADLFKQDWPQGLNRQTLDPYFDLVGYMLDIKPITTVKSRPLPPKSLALLKSAEDLGRRPQVFHPNLAIDFSSPDTPKPNKFGVSQSGCKHCGECIIGCNQHAKNTLDLNYLAIAESHRAHVKTRCEVTSIAPLDDRYRVEYRNHESGESLHVEARQVFLCAGAINSTELLLRCRDTHKTLPKISERLGFGYSGNGDFLGLGFYAKQPMEPANGPTITTAMLYDRKEEQKRAWFLLEDGGAPRELSKFVTAVSPTFGWLKSGTHHLWDDVRQEVHHAAQLASAPTDPSWERNAVYLLMGQDVANGRLHLDPNTGELEIDWDVVSNLPLYTTEERLLKDVCETLGAAAVTNPMWNRFHQAAATHNLGGCTMGDSPSQGVTSHIGEVFGYPNLFVLDGGIIPTAIGANPSATIAAVAERSIEAIIRRTKRDPSWRAPEFSHVTPIHEPLDDVVSTTGQDTPAPRNKMVGIKFTETMRGHAVKGYQPETDYRSAEKQGQHSGSKAEFTVTIIVPAVDEFIADPSCSAIASGVVFVDGITGPEGAPVRDGLFNAFESADSPDARRMLYALPFHGADGKPYLLDGWKDVRDHGGFDVWESTTTLYTVIREGHSRSGKVVATGIIRISIADFMKQLSTFRATGTESPIESADAIARFGRAFLGSLYDVYVRSKLPF